MKKLYTLIIAGLMSAGAFAQSAPNLSFPQQRTLRTPVSMPQKPQQPAATNTFVIDYDSAESGFWASQYARFIWDFNNNYTPADSFTLKYFVVAFDSLYDSYNQIGYPRSTVTTIKCDSIFMVLGQENNSGTDDTIRIEMISVNANGYPASTVLWSWDEIIPASSPYSPDWLQPVILSLGCGYTVTNNDRFALRIKYMGNKMDTAGWIAGFGDNGACASNTVSAIRTQYSPWKINASTWYQGNTFSLWNQYASYGILPNSAGANIYYDCNQNSQYDVGSDGENFLQNISVWVKVTTDPVGVAENTELGVKLYQNKPNPFNGNTTITYELGNTSDVTMTVYDIAGNAIMNFNEGKQAAGRHEISLDGASLNAGIYFYTINVNGSKLTNKMTVIK
jgi:hypothetical protein